MQDPVTDESPDGIDLLTVLAVSKAEALALGRAEVVERLVEGGYSRLSAERMTDVQLGPAERGRARTHSQSRR